MMLVSLMPHGPSLPEPRLLRLRKLRKPRPSRRGSLETARGEGLRNRDQRPRAAPVFRRWNADPARKQIAEAAQVGETNFEAHTCNRFVSKRQQMLRTVEARADPELVRRVTKQRIELTDEVKRDMAASRATSSMLTGRSWTSHSMSRHGSP